EAVLHAIRGREKAERSGYRLSLRRPRYQLIAHHQWAGWKLNQILRVRVHEVAVFFLKSQLPQGIANTSSWDRAFLDEVEILRDVHAFRPDLHAGCPADRTFATTARYAKLS